MKSTLNISNLEIATYSIIWIGAVLFAGFKVKGISNEIFTGSNHNLFSDGWLLLGGRKKDASDYDWEIITYIICHQFVWLCGHLTISEILRQKNHYKLLPFAQISITLSYLIYNFNVSVLLVILSQPILFEVLSKLKRKRLIWIFEAICFIFLYMYKYCPHQRCIPYFSAYISHNDHTLIMLSIYWTNLRCISYTISKIDKNIRRTGFSVVLSYCLYLPLLTFGPFVDIHSFMECQAESKHTLPRRILICCRNICRFMFWWAVTDFLLHYIYTSYLSYYPKFVETLDSWTLCGYGYCMGQYFHLKYVVSYGISTTLAKFENIPAPNTPKCIGRIHLYSDMWRYFDNGLYVFLKSYIYVPLKEVRFPPYLASFFSFCFVYVWHGLTRDIMIWAFLNYICVTMESGFKGSYNKYLKQRCEKTVTLIWRHRLACMLASPLLAISAISNFYFFAGYEIGNIFFKNVFGGSARSLCTLLFCLYCCCQVSSYIKKKEMLEISKHK